MAKTVELSTWTAQQGADFLAQRLGDATHRADAQALAQALGGLPLALEQAASYIDTAGGTVAQYLGLWQTEAAELLNRNSASTGYENPVGATLSLAFKHLSPAPQQLLRLCAFAAPEPLPERFFTEGNEWLPIELRAAAVKPMAWNDVAGELRRYALAQRDAIPSLEREWLAGGQSPEGTPTELALTLHRLTQQVVRDQLAEPEPDEAVLLSLLQDACPRDAGDPSQWPRLAALLPHAVWVNDTDDPGSRVATDEPEQVLARTFLLDRAAMYLQYGLALYPQARGLFEQALAVRRRVLGEEHPATLTSMNNLALTLSAQGDLAGARSLQEQVLAVSRRVLGEEHPDTLGSMNNLANTLRAQGDLAGARSLHEQALAVRRRVLGEEHPDTLTSMNNLAESLRAQGDLAGARSLGEQALAVRRRVLGEEHSDTLTSMNNLAVSLMHLGEHDDAIELMSQAARGRAATLGAEHPDAQSSAESLANMQQSAGR